MRAVSIVLLVVVWFLSACGVKNGPRPPKPEPPPQTSYLDPCTAIGCIASRRGEFLYMYWLV